MAALKETIIGTGIDITEVRRLRQAIEKWGDSFTNRIFLPEELKTAKEKVTLYQHLAGRFAAKEAIYKAIGDTSLGFKDIRIYNDSDGKPHCEIRKKTKPNITIHLSISHVKSYAVANALVTQKA